MFDSFLKSKFYSKCKTAIKVTKTRIEMIKRKRNAMEKFLKKDIADLLMNGLDINAYGRAEGILIELNMSACYNFVGEFCLCLSKQVSAMDKQRDCPRECNEAVSSLMYAAARFADLPELRDLRTIFLEKYGNTIEANVNQEFVMRLKATPPTKEMKIQLLQDLALESGKNWDSKALEQKLYVPPSPEDARKNGLPFWNKGARSDDNQIVVAFETFRQLSKVYIRPMTAISPMNNMHEDICTSAERKRAAIIILPFHKHQRLDGQLETTRNDFRYVNKRILEHAPCSVGILVDRGLGGPTHVSASTVNSLFTVLFFGGPDDREALACGARMAEHPGITLKVVRFSVDPEVLGEIVKIDIEPGFLSSPEERSADDEYISEFKIKMPCNERIKYEERVVCDVDETIKAIRELGKCNLFLVGRMPEGELVAALNIKGDSPELGPIGSLLTLPDFQTTASVLVVQQYHSQLSLHSLASLKEDVDDDEEFPGRDSDTN